MINKRDYTSVMQIREMAKVCTLQMFRGFLSICPEVYVNEEEDGEWIDFEFYGVSFSIGWDVNKKPYLSNYYSYWDDDLDDSVFDYRIGEPIFLRPDTRG